MLVLGKRKGWPQEGHPPHSMPLVMLGTGILWFGWFGFNAGSAFAANGQAVQAFMNTFLAAAAAGIAWVVVERVRDGHSTNLGAASGIVAGLVAITPAAGLRLRAWHRSSSALIAGVVCCYAVQVKIKAGYDDALDVVGVHFVGGLVGSLLIGFFANPDFFGGSLRGGPLLRRRRQPARRAVAGQRRDDRLVVRVHVRHHEGARRDDRASACPKRSRTAGSTSPSTPRRRTTPELPTMERCASPG